MSNSKACNIKSIYVYDIRTGELKQTFCSGRDMEKQFELYRGASLKIQKTHQGKFEDWIISKEKYDLFPLNTLSEKILPYVRLKKPLPPAFVSPPMEKEQVPGNVLSEDQLRQKHDMFFIVRSYIDKLPVGQFIEEAQMLRELGLYGKPRYRDAITRTELRDNKGKVDGTTYYGHIDSIRKLKQEGVLQ